MGGRAHRWSLRVSLVSRRLSRACRLKGFICSVSGGGGGGGGDGRGSGGAAAGVAGAVATDVATAKPYTPNPES